MGCPWSPESQAPSLLQLGAVDRHSVTSGPLQLCVDIPAFAHHLVAGFLDGKLRDCLEAQTITDHDQNAGNVDR